MRSEKGSECSLSIGSAESSVGSSASLRKAPSNLCCCGLVTVKVGLTVCGAVWLLISIGIFVAFQFHKSPLRQLGLGSETVPCFVAMEAAMAISMTVLLFYSIYKESQEQLFPYLVYLTLALFLYAMIAVTLMVYLIVFMYPEYWYEEDHTAPMKQLMQTRKILYFGLLMFAILAAAVIYGCILLALSCRVWKYFRWASLANARRSAVAFLNGSTEPLTRTGRERRVTVPIAIFKQQPDFDTILPPAKF